MTGDHVTRADSPYIVTLKASDKRAGVVRAGNKLEGENSGENSQVGRQVRRKSAKYYSGKV